MMKQDLPALAIHHLPRTQQVPVSPISVASSISSTLRTPYDDEDFHLIKSALFGARWDPIPRSASAGPSTKSLSRLSRFHANPYGPFPIDVEPPSPFIAEPEEPFAVLGSVGGSNPYFIGIPTPREYDRFIHTGEHPEALRPEKLSTQQRHFKNLEQNLVKPRTKVPTMRSKPPPMPPLPTNVFKPEVDTPHSALTFAAVWDPEQGMSTFTGGRLFEDTYRPPPRSLEKSTMIDAAYISSRYIIPPTPQFNGRSTNVASSTLDGLDVYLPQPKGSRRPQNKYRPPSIDDEGFFETFGDSDHPDCEPHLPSRFSVTTTSTSNYIDVDFPPEGAVTEDSTIPPVPPIPEVYRKEHGEPTTASLKSAISPPFLLLPVRRASHIRPSDSTTSFNFSLSRTRSSPSCSRNKATFLPHNTDHGSARNITTSPSSYKQPTRQPSRARLSSVLGKLRRSSQDEGWVSVEVTSVITDRVIKDA